MSNTTAPESFTAPIERQWKLREQMRMIAMRTPSFIDQATKMRKILEQVANSSPENFALVTALLDQAAATPTR